jgi:hypothetical protein
MASAGFAWQDFNWRLSMSQHRTEFRSLRNAAAEHLNGTVLAMTVLICSILSGCVRPEQPVHEEPPAPQPAQSAEAPPEQMPALPPPTLDGVSEALNRVFKEAATIDTGRETSFIAGDFNGDFSQDIAVIVKPRPGKLEELNTEFPNWLLRDPLEGDQPRTAPLRIERDDGLLAVIHGHGPNGWRDSEATQTFLLKRSAGSGLTTHQRKEFLAANRGKKLPQLRGDLIGAVLEQGSGYLYYTGPTYSWYDPRTFKGEPPKKLVHGRATAQVQQ